jgi:hypothetical protein
MKKSSKSKQEIFDDELAKAGESGDEMDGFTIGRFFEPGEKGIQYEQVQQHVLEMEEDYTNDPEDDTMIDLSGLYEKKALQKKHNHWCSARSLAILCSIVTFVLITTAAFLVWGIAPAEEKATDPKGVWFEDKESWKDEWKDEWFHKNEEEQDVTVNDNSTVVEVKERMEVEPESEAGSEPKKAMGIWFGDEIQAKGEAENGGH